MAPWLSSRWRCCCYRFVATLSGRLLQAATSCGPHSENAAVRLNSVLIFPARCGLDISGPSISCDHGAFRRRQDNFAARHRRVESPLSARLETLGGGDPRPAEPRLLPWQSALDVRFGLRAAAFRARARLRSEIYDRLAAAADRTKYSSGGMRQRVALRRGAGDGAGSAAARRTVQQPRCAAAR